MTAPVRPPSDIRFVCQDHTSVEVSSHTDTWAHLLEDHTDETTGRIEVWPLWQCLATQPE